MNNFKFDLHAEIRSKFANIHTTNAHVLGRYLDCDTNLYVYMVLEDRETKCFYASWLEEAYNVVEK